MKTGNGAHDGVLERIRVREVTGVMHSRESVDKAISDLLLAGVDRADIDLLTSPEIVRAKYGGALISVKEMPDLPRVPRHGFFGYDDLSLIVIGATATLASVGVLAAIAWTISSGAGVMESVAYAVLGALIGGALGFAIARSVRDRLADELGQNRKRGDFIIWARARSPAVEEAAVHILHNHGAEAVRVHEVELEKRVDDIPLSSVRPDPWLGSERLGQL